MSSASRSRATHLGASLVQWASSGPSGGRSESAPTAAEARLRLNEREERAQRSCPPQDRWHRRYRSRRFVDRWMLRSRSTPRATPCDVVFLPILASSLHAASCVKPMATYRFLLSRPANHREFGVALCGSLGCVTLHAVGFSVEPVTMMPHAPGKTPMSTNLKDGRAPRTASSFAGRDTYAVRKTVPAGISPVSV